MIRRGMAPRWEDETFALGKAVLTLHADGTISRATRAHELEPLPAKKVPFTKSEWAQMDAIFREHDRKLAMRRAA